MCQLLGIPFGDSVDFLTPSWAWSHQIGAQQLWFYLWSPLWSWNLPAGNNRAAQQPVVHLKVLGVQHLFLDHVPWRELFLLLGIKYYKNFFNLDVLKKSWIFILWYVYRKSMPHELLPCSTYTFNPELENSGSSDDLLQSIAITAGLGCESDDFYTSAYLAHKYLITQSFSNTI